MPDGKSLLMSAFQKGQSDIYIYALASTTTKQITKIVVYDDFDPAFVDIDDIQGIMFSSNRDNECVCEKCVTKIRHSTSSAIFLCMT